MLTSELGQSVTPSERVKTQSLVLNLFDTIQR